MTAVWADADTSWATPNARRRRPTSPALSRREVLLAAPGDNTTNEFPDWAEPVSQRLAALAMMPANWDSYGSAPMSAQAGSLLVEVLRGLSDYVQSAPMLCPTSTSGVVASWRHDGVNVDISVEASGAVSVYFLDELSAEEWEGELDRAQSLAKWVWTASAK